MEQLALFGPPEPLPEPMNMIDIPVATDVNGYSVSLRGAKPPYITEIDGVTYDVGAGGAVIAMETERDIGYCGGSIKFKTIPHAHWNWTAMRNGDFACGDSESSYAAHQEIIKFWDGKEE